MANRGIFGGTFDPPHLGHLIIAEHIARRRRLDVVSWVPARAPVHKDSAEVTSPEHRLEMVRLATKSNPVFEVSEIEFSLEQPPWTVDLLDYFHKTYPEDKLYLLIGGDSLYELPTWKDYKRLWEFTEIDVAPRPGWNIFAADREVLANVRIVRCPIISISASWIRELVRRGESIRYLVPDSVREYIIAKKLYI